MKSRPIFLSIYFEIQSTLNYLRELLVGFSFDLFSRIYIRFKKNEAWDLSAQDLLKLPQSSLGFQLGCFLLQHELSPQPRCEDHDIFHVLTGYGMDTASEVAMQFFLFGNGKRSPFVNLAMACGAFLFMDKYSLFADAFRRGRNTHRLHDLDHYGLLKMPISQLKAALNLNTVTQWSVAVAVKD